MTEFDDAFNETEVIRGLPFDEYLAIDAVNNSRTKLLEKSPRHYQVNAAIGGTRSMSLGTMVHAATLEPSEFQSTYIAAPPGMRMDKRTKAYKEFLETVPPGMEVVKPSDYSKAVKIAEAVTTDKALARFFGPDCESELTILWTDPDTGVRCKCRLDKFCPGVGILDLKAMQDCSLAQFPWSAKRYGYFQQGPFYRRGVLAAQKAGLLPGTGKDVPIYFLAVETGAEPIWALYALPDAEVTHFDGVIDGALDTIARCQKSGVWPGPNGVEGAPLPLTFPGHLDYGDDNEEVDDGIGEDWGE